MELLDDELKATIKSLSITYDVFGRKVERLAGRQRAEAMAEIEAVDRALAKFRAEQTQRWEKPHDRTDQAPQ